MVDLRSRKYVFVSHCVLAQGVMANGLVRNYPAVIKPVVQFCLDHDINIVQMPCPETNCMAGGLGRPSHGKQWYEEHGLREIASKVAQEQVAYMKKIIEAGNEILAIIGIDFSPSCGVNYLNKGPVIYKATGIYVEELQRYMIEAGLSIPFIGINQRAYKKLEKQLTQMLQRTLT